MAEALDEVIDESGTVTKICTRHREKCPECGGRVSLENRIENKGEMPVYGKKGVRHVVHLEYRCIESHCRTGLFHGYRVFKGGIKVYEEDCFDFLKISAWVLKH